MQKADVRRYLRRLGLPDPGRPSVAALGALQAAHLERVPYETLDLYLGRPTTVDPADSVARVLRGRGGYCYHLNGAFAALLRALGYPVVWHLAGVHANPSVPPPGADGGHLALTVACEGEEWLIDAGLGDGPFEPLPLRPGIWRQDPFRYGLRPSPRVPGGWRLDVMDGATCAGMDFATASAGPGDFADRHAALSGDPGSPFVRTASVIRRDAEGVDMLRGLVLSRRDAAGRHARELLTAADWFTALADIFGLTLADLPEEERLALWRRVAADHRDRQAAGEDAARAAAGAGVGEPAAR
ncbi:arylamine N-acetyltransferase family protein [Streptomyces marincola]|uniref:arylamine N-acetyltransferase family protein n=1 Tax=Streptomyces marincola TaxID=2878388 RepID=UPI001CF4AC3C|nr:arylamine N-acetyltransferase [Streptomyces marincola]UCM91860.1 arylamine N-acetyltransferase [Streptomyces marincola]